MSKLFHVVLIKPSRYDDEGYPVRWQLPFFTSSTLSCLYGLAEDCRHRSVLGKDVQIELHAHDESISRIDIKSMIKLITSDGGVVAFVGVQSNQFPRAMDLADLFLAHDINVCVGGFHVSGSMAMLEEPPQEIKQAQDKGVSLFLGEAEGARLDELIKDAHQGKLQPVYNHLDKLPVVEGQPTPVLPPTEYKHFHPNDESFAFDLGRGCPFECSFCTVINVHGRTSRFRNADDLEVVLRRHGKLGIKNIFLTDDNFSRNKNWEQLFDRLIDLREKENLKFRLMMQVDMLSHKSPRFVEKAVRAGVDQLFVGLETVNPDNLESMKKKHNKVEDYREMLLAWKKHPVMILAGYITGLAADTKESILRDIDTIKNELPIDILLISYLTPLPGSEDHQREVRKGAWMDPDLNKYDLTHRVAHHPVMSDEDWEEAFHEAWRRYYTYEHMDTVLRRSAALGSDKKLTTAAYLLIMKFNPKYFGVYSMDGGIARIKYRDERRPGLPRESWIAFHAKNIVEKAVARIGLGYNLLRLHIKAYRIWWNPKSLDYMDKAITPIKTKTKTKTKTKRKAKAAKQTVLEKTH